MDVTDSPYETIEDVTHEEVNFGVCHLQTPQDVFDRMFKPAGEKRNEFEAIDHPNHYLGKRKYEPIDVINDWELNFQTGNAVKYISRAGRKDPNKTIQDLEKAIWYLQWEIKKLQKLQ